MRNIYILLLLFAPLFCRAQFKATSNGLISEEGNNFVVFDINGKSAENIYSSIESWVLSSFKNPDNVVSKQENKMLNVHGIFENAFTYKYLFHTKRITVDMNLVISIKEGKIKIDAPIINKMFFTLPEYNAALNMNVSKEVVFVFSKEYYERYYVGTDELQPQFLFKDGELRKSYVKYMSNMNDFVNGTISEIVNYAKEQKDNNW